MSPKPKRQLAREHLERAVPAVAAEDFTEAVTWLFAALEAAVVALAEAHGIEAPTQHWTKVDVARELHGSGAVPDDHSGTLDVLNDARKVVIYDGDEPDLGEQSLADLAGEVEAAVKLAEASGS